MPSFSSILWKAEDRAELRITTWNVIGNPLETTVAAST
jgi:hypothetical protein